MNVAAIVTCVSAVVSVVCLLIVLGTVYTVECMYVVAGLVYLAIALMTTRLLQRGLPPEARKPMGFPCFLIGSLWPVLVPFVGLWFMWALLDAVSQPTARRGK